MARRLLPTVVETEYIEPYEPIRSLPALPSLGADRPPNDKDVLIKAVDAYVPGPAHMKILSDQMVREGKVEAEVRVKGPIRGTEPGFCGSRSKTGVYGNVRMTIKMIK